MATFKSNAQEVKRRIMNGAKVMVEAIAMNTESYVKAEFTRFPKPPIRTGTLRRSVNGKLVKNDGQTVTAEVRASTARQALAERFAPDAFLPKKKGQGTRRGKIVEYARIVEEGKKDKTGKKWIMRPRPFMKNGTKRAKKSNSTIAATSLKNI